jgi:putative hydrolase of the HAD superfamily
MGKVLLDFDFMRAAERMRTLTGCGPERLRSAITGGELAVRFELGKIGNEEFRAEVCRLLGVQVPYAEFASAWNSIFLQSPILPDETLAALSRRAALWVLSNTNKLHFGFIEGNYSFLRHFTGRILSFEVGAMKPDHAIFRRALEQAGVAAEEALFVDDHLPNVDAALSMGIDAFQFLSREQFTDQMKARELL